MTTGKDAMQETIDRVNEAISKVDKLTHMRDSSSHSSIQVHGATGWQVTSCLLLAVLGMAAGAFGLYIAADTRSAQRADAIRMNQEATELRQDIKAIRAYINAGMVRPKEK